MKTSAYHSISDLLSRHPVTAWQICIAALAGLALVVDGIDIQLLALVSPVILQDWQVSKAALGPALAAALAGMSFGAGLGGWLGDRFGRKRVLAASTFAFGALTLGASLTEGVPGMTIVRFLSGVGFGAAAPNGIALAAEWLPPRLRPRLAAILSVGTPLGGFLGAAVVLWLLPLFGWRGCFAICGAFSVLLGLAMLGTLPESPAFQIGKGHIESVRRSLSRVAKIDSDLPAMASAPDHVAMKSIFVRDYARLNVGSSVVFFSIAFVAYAVITWSPVLLTASGFTLAEALRATMAFNIAAVAGALLSPLLIERFGSRTVLLVCTGGVLVCLGVLVVMLESDLTSASKLLAIAAIGGCGALTGAALAVVYALLTCAYPTECRASGIGFGMTVGRLGAIATILTSGYLLELSDSSVVPFAISLSAFAVCAAVGTLVVDRHLVGRRRHQ